MLIHNGNFINRKYICKIDISTNTPNYVTNDVFNPNQCYCLLHSADGALLPNTTIKVNYVCIGEN